VQDITFLFFSTIGEMKITAGEFYENVKIESINFALQIY
jgi:hypothetical protein